MKIIRFLVLLILAILIAGCSNSHQAVPISVTFTPTTQVASATLTVTATGMPASPTSTPETATGNISPTPYLLTPTPYTLPHSKERGEAFRFDDVAQVTYSGVTYRLSHLLVARRETVLPELYAYSPLLVGEQTLLYVRLEVTNNGNTDVIAPPVGLLALLDEQGRSLDAIRLADTLQAGTVLPHTSDQSLEPGQSYTLGFWLGTEVPPSEIMGLDLVLNCPIPQGSQNCLGNVVLGASLNHDKPLAQVYDLSQVGASSSSEPVTVGGVTFELARLFAAPSVSVPEIANLLPENTQTVVQLLYRITNKTDEPLAAHYLENALFAWDVHPPQQPENITLTDFYDSGLSFARDLADNQGQLIQPGETILTGIWFGLPVPITDLGEELFTAGGLICQADVEPGPQTCSGKSPAFHLSVPGSYASFPSLVTPDQPQEIALLENQPCPAIQPALQATIPQGQWGLKYQTNAANPPEMKFLGVTSGQVSTLEVAGRRPDERYHLDLARLYYLDTGGSIEDVWVTLGMTALSLPDQPYYSFGLGAQAWRSSQEAQAVFSQPGQLYQVVISDWYVHPDGLQWVQCYASQTTLPFECDLGLLLDKGGSTQFFENSITPDNWIAVDWGLYPQASISLIAIPTECP